MKSYIEFKKQRDFGTILADTFGFIRNEFKPFMKAIFSIAGPAMVLYLIALALYTYSTGEMIDFDIYNSYGSNTNPFVLIVLIFAYAITGIIAYVMLSSAVLHYIKSYINNKGQVDIDEVRRKTYKSFWGFFGLGVLKGITIIFAIALCILPVFYVMVPMLIVFSIYVFETERSATDAYSHSFYLVNEDFWLSLGTIIVLGIIFYILNLVFAVPTLIYTYAKMGIFSGEFDPADMGNFVDPVYIALNVLGTFIQYILNIILVVGGALIYFHLNEKRNFTGTYERINSIGNTED